MQRRRFTSAELARYHGRDGAPAFIAYKGKVYDVSGSFLWKGGTHQALHAAGTDLTGHLAQAPHGPEVVRPFPVVGDLCDE